MLSKAIRDELEAELQALRLQRKRAVDALDLKISALEAVLKPTDEILLFEHRQTSQQSETTSPPKGGAGSNGNGSLAGKGLRDAMRSVLRSYPGGLKAVALARKLEESGYKPDGNLSIKTRVNGEAYRMFKTGKLNRRAGKYSLPAEGGGGTEQ